MASCLRRQRLADLADGAETRRSAARVERRRRRDHNRARQALREHEI